MNSIRRETNTKIPSLRLWLAFFAYTAAVGFMVQFIILPYVFSLWHAGNGLLISLPDCITFHRSAVELSQKMRTLGWSVWELRPEGQAPVGIVAAVYVLTVPQPWVLIPVNAALHAIAVLILLRIVQLFIPNWRKAIWCVLPFLIYPSAMTWHTQIHKDGYLIAGAFLFIYGWVLLAQLERWNVWWRPLTALLSLLLGVVLVWIVRPYGVQMMQGIGVVLAVLLTGVFTVYGARGRITWRKAVTGILIFWTVLVAMTPLTKGGISAEVPSAKVPSAKVPAGTQRPMSRAEPGGISGERASMDLWKKSSMLPSFLENKFYALAQIRQMFITGYPDARSNIDTDVNFHSVWEIIAYLPRASEIGFLAPFPNQWFEQGTLPANTMMRRISAVEMVGGYLAFIFLPYAIWHWRWRIEMWLILSFCSGMVLIYAVAIPNIGTLYRLRYGYLMTLVALGIAGFFAVREAWWLSRERQSPKKEH